MASNALSTTVAQSYDLANSCYQGIFEAWGIIVDYGAFATDSSFLSTNLIYNFGLIYDSLKDAIMFFVDPTLSKAKTTFDIGFELGSVFYYILIKKSVY